MESDSLFPSALRGLPRYDAWANARLLSACADLSDEEYTRDVGLVFGSVHSTLAHVLLAHELWLARVQGRGGDPIVLPSSPPVDADAVAALWNPPRRGEDGDADPLRFGAVVGRAELGEALADVCRRWEEHLDTIVQRVGEAAAWASEFEYANTSGQRRYIKRLGPVVQHVFNHATHHRGQASAAITILRGAAAAPEMDIVYYLDPKS